MKRLHFLTIILAAIFNFPTLAQSNTPRAEVYIPIPGYVILEMYSADTLNAEDGGIMTVNTATGELQMLATNEPGVAPYTNPIEDFQRQRVIYEQFQGQFVLHDLRTNSRDRFDTPSNYEGRVVGITDDGNGLVLHSLVNAGSQNDRAIFADSLEIFDLTTGAVTPILSYTWGQPLPEFGLPSNMVYSPSLSADVNSTNSRWIAYGITARNPEFTGYDPPPDSSIGVKVVFNWETSQTIVLNDVFPNYRLGAGRPRWSRDGRYLHFTALKTIRDWVEVIVTLDETGNVQPYEEALNNGEWYMLDWLGIGRLLLVYHINPDSEDMLFQIGRISNGTMVFEDFFRLPTEGLNINFVGDWGTYLLTATPEEQRQLACEFDLPDCQEGNP